jgi:hypothetical protein
MGKLKNFLLMTAVDAWVMSAKVVGRLIAIQLVGKHGNEEENYFFTTFCHSLATK